MPKNTSTTRSAMKAMVTPSSRDSITGWLDVLTSMLSLPESQRLQVRDELEDHLRSRVDDLLITGTAEPEAVRVAVAELGETAELAKLISHAHTRANPRRRMMNFALVTAAVAGLSIGGISLNSAPSAKDIDPYTQAVLATTDSNETRMLDIVNMPTLMAFDAIADMWGFAIDVHSLGPHIVSDLQHRNVTVAGEMTLIRAIQILKIQSLQHASELTTEINGDVIELLTHDELIRRETQVRTYTLDWSNMETATQVFHALNDVVGNGQYAQYFSARFIGNQLVVDAQNQAHEQVEHVLGESRVAYEMLVLREKAEFDRTVKELQKEFNDARNALLDSQEKLRVLKSNLISEQLAAFSPGTKAGRDNAENDRLLRSINEFELETDENEERYRFLRERLLESEYAKLFDGLN